MKKVKLLELFLLTLVTFSFAAFNPLHAQVSEQFKSGFSISPPSFDIKANPGDVLNNSVKIENITSQRLDLTAKAISFVAYGNEGQIQLTDDDSTYSIKSWVTFQNPEFSVEPGEVKLFNYFINIPQTVQPGSHFGSIVFSTSPTASQTTSAQVVQEIGSVILIKLPGDVVENAIISSFKSDSNYFTDPKIKLDAILDNTGSVVVQPSGTITVQDIFGNTVQTVNVQPKNILPGSQRVFDQEFDFDKVGFFKAKLELKYGTGKTLTADTTFISLYTQRLIPVIGLILLLVILYFVFRKRINKALVVIIKG
ncbi:MAG: hypothetical protein ACMG57_00790 [Candidatus Dojkabacteria bacterium]